MAGWGITDKRQNTIPTGISLKKVTLPFTPVKVVQEKKDSTFKLMEDFFSPLSNRLNRNVVVFQNLRRPPISGFPSTHPPPRCSSVPVLEAIGG